MNSQTVEITSAGIRKILNKYTPERAIAEYVWNGFDAKATVVNIDFEIDNAELDTIKNIRITDNGTGICYEELPIKFKKFYESQKRIANENGTDFRDGRPHNIVVEIKNPTTIKQLKSEQLNQLEQYMDVILKQDCFNDANEFWTFILIGQDYDDIVGRRVINKLTGLVQNDSNYSLYVKKWSEITNEVERRLKYLLDKLKIERATLSKSQSLNEVMNEVSNNTAAMVS